VAGALPEGAEVLVFNERIVGDLMVWAKIKDAEGRTGWVAEQYLSRR
jgi:SH3-like domain-containing protein